MRRRRPSQRKQLVSGMILIAIGVMFFLDQIHVAEVGYFVSNYWPLFILIPGVIKLLDPGDRGGAVWMIAIGSWLLVANLGLWGLTWGNSWPLILIASGAAIMFEGVLPGIRRSKHGDEEASDEGNER